MCSVASVVYDPVTPRTVAHHGIFHGILSMEFSYQEYWSRLPWPPLGNLADLEIKSGSPVLQVDSLVLSPQGKPCGVELFIIKNVLS